MSACLWNVNFTPDGQCDNLLHSNYKLITHSSEHPCPTRPHQECETAGPRESSWLADPYQCCAKRGDSYLQKSLVYKNTNVQCHD